MADSCNRYASPFEPGLDSVSLSNTKQSMSLLDAEISASNQPSILSLFPLVSAESLISNERFSQYDDNPDHELSEGTISEVGLSPHKTSDRDKIPLQSLPSSSPILNSNHPVPSQDDPTSGPAESESYSAMSGSAKGKDKYSSEDEDTWEEDVQEEDCEEDFHTFDIRDFFLRAFKAAINDAASAASDSATCDDYDYECHAISDSETPQDHELEHGSLDGCSPITGSLVISAADVDGDQHVDYSVCKPMKRKASFVEGPSRITLDDIRRRERMQALNAYEWQRFP